MHKIWKLLNLRRKYFPDCFPFTTTEPKSEMLPPEDICGPGILVTRMVDGVAEVYAEMTALCSMCQIDLSTIKCLQCQRLFCPQCDTVQHKPVKRRNHNRLETDPGLPFIFAPVGYDEFFRDHTTIVKKCSKPSIEEWASSRIDILEKTYQLHVLLNRDIEQEEVKQSPRDFYELPLVDTHVHLTTSMSASHFLEFVRHKLQTEPERILDQKDGLTLRQILERTGISEANLTVDSLNMKSDTTVQSSPFGANLSKYNPFGDNTLRQVFMKWDNDFQGQYLAELIRSAPQPFSGEREYFSEPRITLYGRNRDAWSRLANWMKRWPLPKGQRPIIQIPRLYSIWRAQKFVANFQEFLENIFLPLFEVTCDPSVNPALHEFLQAISGFDSVDEEKKDSLQPNLPTPQLWTSEEDPPYDYYLYYMWANIRVLNLTRMRRGLNTFSLRPHCGESGSVWHLASGFLLADSVVHALELVNSHALLYLFYLAQVGISVSPIAENSLYCAYDKNPFYYYFKSGLNVTLSTDNPLSHHFSSEPLVEEVALAAQMWKLSKVDLAEISRLFPTLTCRNAIELSDLHRETKLRLLGPLWWSQFRGELTMDNIPTTRRKFREVQLP